MALPRDIGQISTLKVKRIFKNPQDVMQRRVPVPALNCVGDPMLQQRFHQFYSENEVVVPGVAEAHRESLALGHPMVPDLEGKMRQEYAERTGDHMVFSLSQKSIHFFYG